MRRRRHAGRVPRRHARPSHARERTGLRARRRGAAQDHSERKHRQYPVAAGSTRPCGRLCAAGAGSEGQVARRRHVRKEYRQAACGLRRARGGDVVRSVFGRHLPHACARPAPWTGGRSLRPRRLAGPQPVAAFRHAASPHSRLRAAPLHRIRCAGAAGVRAAIRQDRMRSRRYSPRPYADCPSSPGRSATKPTGNARCATPTR